MARDDLPGSQATHNEGVLPSDKEVTAVLEAIEKGKKSLSPGKQ